MKCLIFALVVIYGSLLLFYSWGKLDYEYGNNNNDVCFWTTILLKNSGLTDIELQSAEFYVDEAIFREQRNMVYDNCTYKEIMFKRSGMYNDQQEVCKFYNPDTKIIIPARDSTWIRIRLKNSDYLELQLIGELRIKHSRGKLSLKNVCVDVEP